MLKIIQNVRKVEMLRKSICIETGFSKLLQAFTCEVRPSNILPSPLDATMEVKQINLTKLEK